MELRSNDDPNRPQYSYARQVDYISGCSLAMPTALWLDLGGFEHAFYRPAYCEDVDLAFRVRSCGREVWFQPQSRMVHYEGKTSGTSTAAGIKAYQIVNTKKLYFRWREALAHHRPNGEAPYFERERTARKRFLVVDATTPTPDQDAGSVQTFMALQTCLALGYKTHLCRTTGFISRNILRFCRRSALTALSLPMKLGLKTISGDTVGCLTLYWLTAPE